MSEEQVTSQNSTPRKPRSANIPVGVKIANLRAQADAQLAKAQKSAHDAQDALNKALERLADAEKSHEELTQAVKG